MSEAQALENESQDAGKKDEPVEQLNQPEFNGYIDYDSEVWKAAPEEVRTQSRQRIDKDSREKAELKRKLEEQAAKLAELKAAQLEAQKPKEVDPPDKDLAVTNPDEFDRRLEAYQAATRKSLEWEQQKLAHEQQQQAENERVLQQKVNAFQERARSASIGQQELQMAEAMVANSLKDQAIAQYILGHEQGPQILMHLAKNPLELQSIVSLNTPMAGAKLDRVADKYRSKVISEAPPPDDPVKGTPPANTGFGPPGATYI
jgi:hypothetical protein